MGTGLCLICRLKLPPLAEAMGLAKRVIKNKQSQLRFLSPDDVHPQTLDC